MNLKEKALEEYNNPDCAIRRGGVNGNAFWNIQAQAFMFCPSFDFAPLAGCKSYLFEAEDESGKKYSFTDESTYALLTPIWNDLQPGQIQLCAGSLKLWTLSAVPLTATSEHSLSKLWGATAGIWL